MTSDQPRHRTNLNGIRGSSDGHDSDPHPQDQPTDDKLISSVVISLAERGLVIRWSAHLGNRLGGRGDGHAPYLSLSSSLFHTKLIHCEPN